MAPGPVLGGAVNSTLHPVNRASLWELPYQDDGLERGRTTVRGGQAKAVPPHAQSCDGFGQSGSLIGGIVSLVTALQHLLEDKAGMPAVLKMSFRPGNHGSSYPPPRCQLASEAARGSPLG